MIGQLQGVAPTALSISKRRAPVAPLLADLPSTTWDLVSAAQQGDIAAFAELYDRHVAVVFRYVLIRVGSRELAEDITSETFLRALRRIGSVSDQGCTVAAWFVTIARNLILDHVKSCRFRLETLVGEFDMPHQVGGPGPEQQTISAATAAMLLRQVAKLGDGQRECITLRFLQGFSVTETAEIMQRTEGAVKSMQHRAIRRLARALSPELV